MQEFIEQLTVIETEFLAEVDNTGYTIDEDSYTIINKIDRYGLRAPQVACSDYEYEAEKKTKCTMEEFIKKILWRRKEESPPRRIRSRAQRFDNRRGGAVSQPAAQGSAHAPLRI